METEKTLEELLHESLTRLSNNVARMRESGVDQHELELITADHELQWREDLEKAERSEMRGAKTGVTAMIAEQELQKQLEAYQRDSTQLVAMSPEEQIAFWDKHAASRTENRRQAEETSAQALVVAATAIRERFDGLKQTLERTGQNIELGASIDLSPLEISSENATNSFVEAEENADRDLDRLNQQLEAYRKRGRER